MNSREHEMASTELAEVVAMMAAGRARLGPAVLTPEQHRTRYRRLAQILSPPRGIMVEAASLGGVPCEWHAGAHLDTDRMVLYFHGGGYAIGGLDTHRSLAGHLSRATAAPVLTVDYRLAPEHPYPSAIEDAATVYSELLDVGFAPERLAVAGDSAGAGLAVSLALRLRDAGTALPTALVLISPWLDLAADFEAWHPADRDDPVTEPLHLAQMRDWYLAGHDPADPAVSPLNALPSGLPPTLIQVGTRDLLAGDAMRFADLLSSNGVDVDLEVWPQAIHVWHLFAGEVPEAAAALRRIGEWLEQAFSLTKEPT